MSEMIERVARALDPETFARKDSGEISDDLNDCVYHAMENARSAIEAMRKPTAEMIKAGSVMHCQDYEAEIIWDDMVDAALGQSRW